MSFSAGTGFSNHRNPKQAGIDAVQAALQDAGIDQPDFVLMFAAIGYNQEAIVKAVRQASGNAPLIGCSAEGIISRAHVVEENYGALVTVIKSDEIRFEGVYAKGLREDSFQVGCDLATAVNPLVQEDTLGLLVLTDGVTLNFDKFYQGFDEHKSFARFLPLLGGLAGDNFEFKDTYQYCDDTVGTDGVAGAVISGQGQLISEVCHGCVPVGGERKVTRSEGNVIYEIDGKRALDVLSEYVGAKEIDDWQRTIVSLSLGFRAPDFMGTDYDEFVVRFIPSKDDEKGSIAISTEVPVGSSVWMTRRDIDKIQNSNDVMVTRLKSRLGGKKPKLVIQFDCGGRGKLMFDDDQRWALQQRLQSSFDMDAPWAGMFSFGEIGPVGNQNCFHNYTVVLLALC